jgi:hypothetical protein
VVVTGEVAVVAVVVLDVVASVAVTSVVVTAVEDEAGAPVEVVATSPSEPEQAATVNTATKAIRTIRLIMSRPRR